MQENWDKIKIHIHKETKKAIAGRFHCNELDLIEVFRKVLIFPINNPAIRLNGLETRVMHALDKVFNNGQTKADNHSYFLEIAKIEPFLRKILYLINPERYQQLAATRSGLNSFVKELGLNSGNIKLAMASASNYQNNPQLLDKIIEVYHLRNIESHECDEWTSAELHSHIQNALIVCLFTIDKHLQQISQVLDPYFANQGKDFTDYLNMVINTFEEKMKRFIHIRGKEDFKLSSSIAIELSAPEKDQERAERKGNILDLRNNEIPEKRMAIWADAGMGKTTTLEYLSYLDSKDKLTDNQKPLPVYLALGLLTDKNVTIKQSILIKIGVDAEYGDRLLSEGKIHLFLDGLNEIPKDDNFSLRTIRHREIQNLLTQYQETFIILSNRPQDINDFRNIPVFMLQKMDRDQVRDFVTKNTSDNPNIAGQILTAIDEDERLFRIIKTPLMLSRLIEISRVMGELPKSEGEIIRSFINSLYRREREEKKDANFDVKKIDRLLRYLGHITLEKYGTNSGISEDEVLNHFVECKTKYGFEIDTIYVLDTVTQLNILERNGTQYTFAHQAYQDYFHSQEEKAIANL
ncbi:NACHT domain-containing protein [Sediminibacterium roseum]|uniref:NACHT domain-containing protein n=1 Tax=Sediminibacterium roseum TaxID=1978412 RepID=A0ABW9ZW95_9BACT|nr:NACHT domain-containing protein [Sediminibacterium roseum]NCI51400.1 NACHT domain-containing protein [Sediminibacterium roseum]